jgi:hypothetical protein
MRGSQKLSPRSNYYNTDLYTEERKHEGTLCNTVAVSSARSNASDTMPRPGAAEPLLDTDGLSHEKGMSPAAIQLWRLDRACWHIQDAMSGVSRVHPQGGGAARLAYTAHVRLLPWLPYVAAVFVAVTFFEPPQWCLAVQEQGGPALCDDPSYPSFDLPVLPRRLNLAAELACLLALGGDVGLRLVCQGLHRWAGSPRQVCAGLLVLAAVADMVWGYSTPGYWWRAAPYLRAGLLLSYSVAVRQQLFLMQRAIPAFSATALLVILYVGFAAYVATLVFPAGTAEGDAVMTGYTEAAWQLLILLTTANFPDVMMPAYTQCRAAALFFAGFVMFGVFFLMNYLLAVVYGSYTAQVKLLKEEAMLRQQASIDAAFAQLDWEGQAFLSHARLSLMLDHLPRSTSISETAAASGPSTLADRTASKLSASMQRALLFATLDASGDAEIQRDEFSQLCTILQLRYRRRDTRSLLQHACPKAAAASRLAARLREILSSTAFDHVLDAALILSAISLGVDPTMSAAAATNGRHHRVGLSPSQAFFSALFLVEVCLKWLLLPWRSLSRSSLARFDAAISIAAVAVSVLVYMPNGFDNGAAVRAVLSLRLFRLLRLLRKVHAFNVIASTFFRLLPAATTLLKTVGLLMFVFASTGLHLFGGLITTDTSGALVPAELVEALAESDFGIDGYYANSFNDLPSGILTLFELSVVNNWFVIADGYVAVRGKHARWFFVVYYMLGVVVALNIVVAFVLDAYSAIEESAQQEQQQAEGSGPTAWVDDHLLLDAGRVTGTSTGLTGEIEVSLDPSASLSLTESRRAMLSALFTHRTADGLEATAPPGGGQLPPKQQLARGASWKQQLAQTFSLKAAERDDKQGDTQGGRQGSRGGPSYTPPAPAPAPAAPRTVSFGEAVLGFAQAAAGATALAAVGTEHEVAGDADKT